MNWEIEYRTESDVLVHEVEDTQIVYFFAINQTRIIRAGKVLNIFESSSLKEHYQTVVNIVAQTKGRELNKKAI